MAGEGRSSRSELLPRDLLGETGSAALAPGGLTEATLRARAANDTGTRWALSTSTTIRGQAQGDGTEHDRESEESLHRSSFRSHSDAAPEKKVRRI